MIPDIDNESLIGILRGVPDADGLPDHLERLAESECVICQGVETTQASDESVQARVSLVSHWDQRMLGCGAGR